MKPIRIVGGGLAGLSLGIALRQADVPVTITESGSYPRHRVCGEFISGAGQKILASFGLNHLLADAATNTKTAWFDRHGGLFSDSLPAPAAGLSRFSLDARLARQFEETGGILQTRTTTREPPTTPGTVWACGRRGTSRDWIGLKLHCRGLKQQADLAMHLGSHGYVGVSRIEDDKLNVCGLFRMRRHISPGKAKILPTYLRESGLHILADQLAASEIDTDSITATTALNFTHSPWPDGVVCIGDANTAIPPFSGNGMSMAFESAQTALPHLLRYATGKQTWTATREDVRLAEARRFRLRLAAARLLHPCFFTAAGQRTLAKAAATKLLPFHLLYRLLR